MSRQPDSRFIRCLVLHCLDYLPVTLGRQLVHPDLKTLTAISRAVNTVRSDYYSWFLAVISNIPENDIHNYHCLAAHVRCLTLDSKYEEFLLTCAILVQIAHFVVMKYKCLDSVENVSRSLTTLFFEKYRGFFADGLEEFVAYCETVAKREDGPPITEEAIIDSVVQKEEAPWCKTANEKNILNFWNKTELKRIANVSEAEKAALKQRLSTMEDPNRKMIVIRSYNSYLKKLLTDYKHPKCETRKTVPGWKKCRGVLGMLRLEFCLGCFLNSFYSEMKKETSSVEHNESCHLRNEGGKDSKKDVNKDLCITETPRLPEHLLNFVQKNLDHIVGTCVLKQMRYKMYQEMDMDFEVETCKLCNMQCLKKLLICMDLYVADCVAAEGV